MLHHFANYHFTGVKLNRLLKKYLPNEEGKFGVKIFLRYIDSTMLTLRHFILPHPVVSYISTNCMVSQSNNEKFKR